MVSMPITSAYSKLEAPLLLGFPSRNFQDDKHACSEVRGGGEGMLRLSHPQYFKILAFPHEHIFSNSS
jgi:hypothetical protein